MTSSRPVAFVLALVLAPAVGCARCSSPSPGAGAGDPPAEAVSVRATSAPSPSADPSAPAEGEPGSSAPSPRKPLSRTRGEVETIELFTHGADESSPVVVAIHGMGDAPSNWVQTWRRLPTKAHVVLPRGLDRWGGGGFSWFKYEPGMSADAIADGVAVAERKLWAAIAELAGARRLVVTGFSQGGILSFAIAARHPERVTLALPVSGLLPPKLWPRARPAPVVALHGDKDRVVSYEGGARTVEAFKTLGGSAELVTYPGVEHAVTPAMRQDLWHRIKRAVEATGDAAAAPSP